MGQDTYDRIRAYVKNISGKDAPIISKGDINTLVDAIVSTYQKPNPLPDNYETDPDESKKSVYPLPAASYLDWIQDPDSDIRLANREKLINQALQTALASIRHANILSPSLPIYKKELKLPYDTPEIPLSTIKSRVEIELMNSQ
jgi:hypothetical protein